MKRVMFLALLALGLPATTLANTIDVSDPPPSFNTGTFVRGVITRTSLGGLPNFLAVTVLGNMTQISIGGSTLSPAGNCFTSGTCTITGGTVTVMNATLTATLFTASISTGTVTVTGTGAMIFASLTPNQPGVGPAGGFVKLNVQFSSTPISDSLTGGTGQVTVIPEPGTLGLLGTGVIGLAGIARRKLKRDERTAST